VKKYCFRLLLQIYICPKKIQVAYFFQTQCSVQSYLVAHTCALRGICGTDNCVAFAVFSLCRLRNQRISPRCLLVGCRKRQLNQAVSVLCLIVALKSVFVFFTRASVTVFAYFVFFSMFHILFISTADVSLRN